MDKIKIIYNGEEIKVDKAVADYLDQDRRHEQAEEKRDSRHLSDKDIERYDFNSFIADKPADFTKAFEIADDIQTLYKAMETLTETQRRRVDLYFFDGLAYEQIAERENVHFTSIVESIDAEVKKLKKYFK